jgi:hypothetical protein
LNSSSDYFIYLFRTTPSTQVLQNVRKEKSIHSTFVVGEVLIDSQFPEMVGREDGWDLESGTLLTSKQFEHWKGEHIELFL